MYNVFNIYVHSMSLSWKKQRKVLEKQIKHNTKIYEQRAFINSGGDAAWSVAVCLGDGRVSGEVLGCKYGNTQTAINSILNGDINNFINIYRRCYQLL